MKPDPLIEEIWKTKDELARDAGYDVHRFFDDLRRWSAEHGDSPISVRTAEDLRRLAEEAESQRSQHEGMMLRDKEQQLGKRE